jgi:hypothetical protein
MLSREAAAEANTAQRNNLAAQ